MSLPASLDKVVTGVKLLTQSTTAHGSSGAWVVRDRVFCGMIIAGYEQEPYAHMIPARLLMENIKRSLTHTTDITTFDGDLAGYLRNNNKSALSSILLPPQGTSSTQAPAAAAIPDATPSAATQTSTHVEVPQDQPTEEVPAPDSTLAAIVNGLDDMGFNGTVFLMSALDYFTAWYNLFAVSLVASSLDFVYTFPESSRTMLLSGVIVLVGMALGMLGGGFYANWYGVRMVSAFFRVVLLVGIVGMTTSGVAGEELSTSLIVLWQILTGLGIGCLVSLLMCCC